MKISLNQPNGFTTHFAPHQHKYIDSTPSKSLHIQPSSTEGISSTLTKITEVLSLPSLETTS